MSDRDKKISEFLRTQEKNREILLKGEFFPHRYEWPYQKDQPDSLYRKGGEDSLNRQNKLRISLEHKMKNEMSEKKREKEEDFFQSHEFLFALIENIPNMIFVKEADSLRFVHFNKAGEELLGYSRDYLIGKNDYDLFPEAEANFFTNNDRKVLESKKVLDIPTETIHTRTSGRRILHTKKIPLFDSQGRPAYLLGISEDITEKRQAEEDRLQLMREQVVRVEVEAASLRAQFMNEANKVLASSLNYEETLRNVCRLVVPSMADWCMVGTLENSEGKVEGSLRLMGIINTQDKIRPITEFENMKTSELGPSCMLEAIRTGQPLLFSHILDESAFLHDTSDKEIQERQVKEQEKGPEFLRIIHSLGLNSLMTIPLSVNGKMLGAMMIASSKKGRSYNETDLNLAKELLYRCSLAMENARLYRDAQEAIRVRNDFLSIASHELKTPLTSLSMQIELIHRLAANGALASLSKDKLNELTKISKGQLQRFATLINDLLDASRISEGKLILNIEEVNLTELIQDVVLRYQAELEKKGCLLSLSLEPQLIGRWDRMRIEQIIENLMSNAIKYGAGQPIEIKFHRQENEHVIIHVRDHGIGIAKENQKRIFERFERAVSNKQYGGLGLGLYIVGQIVVVHGGTIHVEGQLGEGAAFIVDLPLQSVK